MNIKGDERISDMEMAQRFWERAKQHMQWCKEQAEEYVKQHPRRKHYKVVYDVDLCEQVAFADFTDDELRKIQEAQDKVVAEEGPFKNEEERRDAFSYCLEDSDVNWEAYVPEEAWHWGDGEPVLVDIDLDDVRYFCRFKVLHTRSYNDNDELTEEHIKLQMNDATFAYLLSQRLFDNRLTFDDLTYLNKEIFQGINDSFYEPHEHHIIFMEEINEAAKEILESKKDDEDYKPVDVRLYAPVVLRTINENTDKFNDPDLLKALRLASM